jgi:hypothetical protein
MTGIEPAQSAWKAETLPLSYSRILKSCAKSVAGILSFKTTIPLGGRLLARSSMLPADSPSFDERPEHKPAQPICTCCPWRLLVSPALKRLVSVALIVNQLALIARALPYTVFYAVPNFLEDAYGFPPVLAVVQLGTTSGATGGVRTRACQFCRLIPYQLGYRSKLTCREPLSKSLAAKLFLRPFLTSAPSCA